MRSKKVKTFFQSKIAFFALTKRNWFIQSKAAFFLFASLIWAGFMYLLDSKDEKFAWHDLLVEANGLFFDLIVFGILLTIYEAAKEKKDKVERLHEEIEDYRGWDEKEAMFRIVGAIKRLNKLKIYSIHLKNCFLQGANLEGATLVRANLEAAVLQDSNLKNANLSNAHLRWANIQNANLDEANLHNANLNGANLNETRLYRANLRDANFDAATIRKALLWDADLRRADLWRADMEGADLRSANLEGAKLYGLPLYSRSTPYGQVFLSTNLQNANLDGVSLIGAVVGKDWFEQLERWEVTGRNEIKEKYQVDENGIIKLK